MTSLLFVISVICILLIIGIFLGKKPLPRDPDKIDDVPASGLNSPVDIDLSLEANSQPETETPVEADPQLEAEPNDLEESLPEHASYLEFKDEIPSKQLPWVKQGFYGRKNEISRIINCVNKEIHHLSLCGMSGVGKTALALHTGNLFIDKFPDGQIYVDLKGDGPRRLSLAEVFGRVIHYLRPSEKLPENKEALQSLYHSILSKKQVFIIFDNVLRVSQASLLLPARNSFVCLISQKPLKIQNVMLLEMDVLALEASMAYLEFMSNQISFRSKEIAKLCGNLPLALTLFGNFLSINRNADLEKSLEKFREDRHQSSVNQKTGSELCITAAFNLSYKALEPITAMVFRKLMVFPDFFTLKAVENICEDEDGVHLHTLVNLGLVDEDRNNNRYYLHEYIRQNLEQRIIIHEQFQVQKYHSKFYVDLLRSVNEFFNKGVADVESILRWFQIEWPNMKSGQAWAFENMELYSEAEKYCCEYSLYAASVLMQKMDSSECVRWFEEGLKATRKLNDKEAEVHHLIFLGEEYLKQKNFERSMHYFEQALSLCSQLENKFLEKKVFGSIGSIYLSRKNALKAIEYFEKILDLSQQLNSSVNEPELIENMAQAYLLAENYAQADLFFVQALRQVDKKNKSGSYMNILKNLAEVNLRMNQLQQAMNYYREGLVQAKLSKNRTDERYLLRQMAEIHIRTEVYSSAIELIKEGLKLCRTREDWPEEAHFHRLQGAACKRIGNHKQSIHHYKSAARLFIKTKNRKMEGESLWHLSQVFAESGNNDQAVKWCKTALDIFERIGHPETKKVQEQFLSLGGTTEESRVTDGG